MLISLKLRLFLFLSIQPNTKTDLDVGENTRGFSKNTKTINE